MKMRAAKRGPASRRTKRLTARAVLRRVENHRDAIRAYGVRRLGLFGSVARGEAKRSSDLDFVVDLERHTFDDYMGLKFYLEDLFRKRVDLVMRDTIKPALRETILGETVYAEGL